MRKHEQRDNEIYARRKAGRTYKSLSSEFGISLERVRQICEKAKRREEREEKGNEFDNRICSLNHGIRIYNALVRGGVRTFEDLRKYSADDLLRFRAMGKVCVDELVEAGLVSEEVTFEYPKSTLVMTPDGIITIEEYQKRQSSIENRG